jgi:hypothetical protein
MSPGSARLAGQDHDRAPPNRHTYPSPGEDPGDHKNDIRTNSRSERHASAVTRFAAEAVTGRATSRNPALWRRRRRRRRGGALTFSRRETAALPRTSSQSGRFGSELTDAYDFQRLPGDGPGSREVDRCRSRAAPRRRGGSRPRDGINESQRVSLTYDPAARRGRGGRLSAAGGGDDGCEPITRSDVGSALGSARRLRRALVQWGRR